MRKYEALWTNFIRFYHIARVKLCLVRHSNHSRRMFGASNHGWENSTWSIFACESRFAHTLTNVIFTNFSTPDPWTKKNFIIPVPLSITRAEISSSILIWGWFFESLEWATSPPEGLAPSFQPTQHRKWCSLFAKFLYVNHIESFFVHHLSLTLIFILLSVHLLLRTNLLFGSLFDFHCGAPTP